MFHGKTVLLTAAAVGSMAFLATTPAGAQNGYYYEARSFYVAPVVTTYYPVLYPTPITVYEPAVVAPAPVTGYFYPAPPPARVRERWSNHPWRSRYEYRVDYPNGLEYKYRVKRDGNYVRYYEKFDD